MSWFKRGSENKADQAENSEDDLATMTPASAEEGSELTATAKIFDRSHGPFDVAEAHDAEGMLDLGGLRLLIRDGLQVQLQVDEASNAITGVFLATGESGVQIQAFAAPRSEGIWSEICEEISVSITEQGGTVDPGYGRFGRELLARIPASLPDGSQGIQPLRFAGVDGPRWLLRAVFHGKAAFDADAAGPLEELVAAAVVVRGSDPMGPRELLALRLPEGTQVTETPGEDPREQLARDEKQPERFDDLQPFSRGPEITERR
ncbi:MAG: DUF3710 domain-containing protein [Actinomycetota bacterium]